MNAEQLLEKLLSLTEQELQLPIVTDNDTIVREVETIEIETDEYKGLVVMVR